MTTETKTAKELTGTTIQAIFAVCLVIGTVSFMVGLAGDHPERAWQAYLVNFLLWTGMAAGGVLFSALMHVTGAKWSGRMAAIAESFSAFFPVSFMLFLILFFGKSYVFPWLHHDLHGKDVWLNIPFLFTRNVVALLVLYGFGFAYLYNSLQLKYGSETDPSGNLRQNLYRRWQDRDISSERIRERMTFLGFLYCFCFAIVLSLIGYDLVMASDPHWISTLFGAYTFVKAVYLGFAALIILSSILYIRNGDATGLKSAHFHDLGKLFFGFVFVWGDFFYAQLVVIWYGNIPEETAFVIERVMIFPWSRLAWIVLIVSFVFPFLILLNQKIKTIPMAMVAICTVAISGIWLEHFLLLGPAFSHGAHGLTIGVSDVLITLGFFGLMAFAVMFFLDQFPEAAVVSEGEGN
ncbi:Putative uncharacterized protein TTHA1760 [Olavius algarvensis associated proteobacterium Delta 3]|nr:Putative uncharacterized protein TTHA1760 [Olavius algarvensis associated proteobacterium Delta 3]CAB5094702.1 Putative uncharacterized protein TTHA1760 [Olavius algarvensis associated proteobacterium Delta 3]